MKAGRIPLEFRPAFMLLNERFFIYSYIQRLAIAASDRI